MTKHNESAEISEEEAKLYDRQIRLWGLDAQKR
jgi:molybdopterin/thiamine biosynthesis adenylyltransferase